MGTRVFLLHQNMNENGKRATACRMSNQFFYNYKDRTEPKSFSAHSRVYILVFPFSFQTNRSKFQTYTTYPSLTLTRRTNTALLSNISRTVIARSINDEHQPQRSTRQLSITSKQKESCCESSPRQYGTHRDEATTRGGSVAWIRFH
jgi:hypothetical protein